MTEKLLLFIPCYNCAAQIGRTLQQVKPIIAGRIAEILVLDNRSSDDTLAEARAAAAAIRGVPVTIGQNQANYHLGGSHKAAFTYAGTHGFSHVIVLHGDDQGNLEDILDIIDRNLHQRYDACLGARFMHGSQLKGYSRFRTFGNRVFNLMFSAVAGRRIYDLGSGLNIFSKKVFDSNFILKTSDDLRFNIYLLLSMIKYKISFFYFPVSWREDDQISNVRMFSQAVRTINIAVEYLLRPARFLGKDHRDKPIDNYAFDVIEQFHLCIDGEKND